MNEEKLPAEMNDDELNKFLNNSIADKFNLNEMKKSLIEDDLVVNYPVEGTDKEKVAYLDDAVEKGIIKSYEPVDKTFEGNEDYQFILSFFKNDKKSLV